MSAPRTVPLFDPHATPSSWNERMRAGEYAVHASHRSAGEGAEPACIVFASRPEAEHYVDTEAALHPELRLRVYDHQGFVGAPLYEGRGSRFAGDTEFSPRVRRWLAALLFGGGLLLILLDWSVDFRLSWPAMVGTRLLFPGLVLLVTEAVLLLVARRKRRAAGNDVQAREAR